MRTLIALLTTTAALTLAACDDPSADQEPIQAPATDRAVGDDDVVEEADDDADLHIGIEADDEGGSFEVDSKDIEADIETRKKKDETD